MEWVGMKFSNISQKLYGNLGVGVYNFTWNLKLPW